MSIRLVAAAAAVLLSSGLARAEECPKNATGMPYATGGGNANPKADTAGLRRLGAERAAFVDGLNKLKACLGDKAKSVTGWSISEVRYFDSDPIVEVDVAPSFDGAAQVTILGSALPNVKDAKDVKDARLKTQTAAKMVAQRNALEALNAMFPADGGNGDARQEIQGSLGGCQPVDIAYWDDQAVSVKLTCGKAVKAPEKAAEPHPAPKVEKRK